MAAQDTGVAQRIRAHHGAMVKALGQLTAEVAQAPDAAALAGTLEALDRYWQHEVMPHAMAEEETIYAAAALLPQGQALIRSLEAEHRDLRNRGLAIQRLRALAAADPAAGPPTWAVALGTTAAMEAAAAVAVFGIHAAKENDFVLPALLDAGTPLGPLLARMEEAFARASRRAQGAAAVS